MSNDIESLHKETSKLNSDQLIELSYKAKLIEANPELITILKTYLFLALIREGIKF